ncbi:MAG TPA: winged helix-turn-helix domain-containing protein [Aliidongia sp.]|nr:winged helix-turn-helix domain-containing protein [Aliidongia sp.]
MDGDAVPISAKALDILAVLVEAGGDLVTKDELLDQVWPGLLVEEHNIQVHVSSLRKALGDDAGWIVTAPKRGYRFIGPFGVTPAAVPLPPFPASLPRAFSRLFGREEDLTTLRSLLDQGRLVTLAGPGGIGKTRVALELVREIADRYRDGTVFVDFSVLQDPSLAASLVATTLGIDVKGSMLPAELVVRRLKDRELLILLDNCEHVLDAVAPLAEFILAETPRISLLATSREPLACRGEQVYRLPPLPVPPDSVSNKEEALASPAVALLVDRIQAADLHFDLSNASAEAASAICRRLDGLPLAIEMIGALAPGLGLEVLASRLEETFHLPYSFSRTATPRHRSLAATLDWSYALLQPQERILLHRLSAFPGPFSLTAVEIVASDDMIPPSQCGDVLAGLVRKSLVSVDPAASPLSYRLLETIRTYAVEKLEEAGEQTLLRARHARFVASVLSDSLVDWDVMIDPAWRDRYRWLLADLRVSLRWAFGPEGDTALGVEIVSQTEPLWQMLGLIGEGRRWADTAATAMTEETPDLVAARVWFAVAFLTLARSLERTVMACRNATELFGWANDPTERGTAMAMLGATLSLMGRTDEAADTLTSARALLGPATSKRRLGLCAMAFGILHACTAAWPDARREYELAQILFQAAGSKRWETVNLINLADAAWTEGDLPTAIKTIEDAADLARRSGQLDLFGMTTGNLAGMLTLQGDLDGALAAAREAVPHCREDEYLIWMFPHLALRLAKAGKIEDAARVWGYAEPTGTVWQTNERRAIESMEALLREGLTAERLQELMEAGRHLGEDQVIALAIG